MANCKATLSVTQATVDVTDKDSVIQGFLLALGEDLDLTDNEDEFREDTLELGYDSEADRIIKEYVEENGFPDSIPSFIEAFGSISETITSQDFFGACETRFLTISETEVFVTFVSGGHED